MLKLIEELQKDREARNVRPTYVPIRILFSAAIIRFGSAFPSHLELYKLVLTGVVTEHDTIQGDAFSIAGTEIKYNAEYGELLND